jgi:hypothetical protein
MKSRIFWSAFEQTARAAHAGLIVCALLVGTWYSASPACADGTELPAVEKPDRHELDDWLRETGDATRESFSKRNIGILAATAAGASVLMFTEGDQEIRDFFQRNNFPEVFNEAGNIVGAIGPPALALGLYADGKISDKERSVEAARVLSSAIAIDLVSTSAMKLVIGRHRPDEDSPSSYDPFSFRHRSFPSGHTSGSFTAAAVMADFYRDKEWVAPVSYTAATLVGISRITGDFHWTSDVLFAAVKGYLIGKAAVKVHAKWKLENVDLIVSSSGRDTLVGLNFRF